MILKILKKGNLNLLQKSILIPKVDKSIITLANNMLETMYEANGVGLAGNQVGVIKRIAVIDTSKEKNNPIVLINPEILELSNPKLVSEGCLSIPDYFDTIERNFNCKVRAINLEGNEFEINATGFLAQALQHEIDHLNGILFISKVKNMGL